MCTKDFLWVDGCYNPPWVGEELRRRGLFQSHDKIIHDEASPFISLLGECAKRKDLCSGLQIHNDVADRGLVAKCSEVLVTMYAKCGEVSKAKELLDLYKVKDIYSWTALISGYAHNGQNQNALDCFKQMQLEGLLPDAVTFVSVLKACGNMKTTVQGEQIHYEIARLGLLQKNIMLGNALVDMYAKCGALVKAQQVLEELPVRNVICWSSLISGYAQQGKTEEALMCFSGMQQDGFSPNAVTFLSLLKACANTGALNIGGLIHDLIDEKGLMKDNTALGNAVVNMYAKCGALVKAHEVVEEISLQTVVAWNAIITGYVVREQAQQALDCFEKMLNRGISPNAVTYICGLKACGSLRAIKKGEEFHDEISRKGLLGESILLGTALVDMYAKCGFLAKAEQVHAGLRSRDVVSWSALIGGYSQQGQGEQALKCYEQMQQERVSPNAVTMLSVLKACGSIGAADKGEQFHDEINRQGWLKTDPILGTAVVDMYVKCNALVKAQEVLQILPVQSSASWYALVAGYVEHGQAEQALNCYKSMKSNGIYPDSVTFLGLLKACGNAGAIDMGKQIHEEIDREEMFRKDIVLGNALVDMYAKCGAFGEALLVFDKLPARDVFSWSALISAYAQQDLGEQAWSCFECMQLEGISPNTVTFMSILKACGNIRDVSRGVLIHEQITTQGLLENDAALGTALVDMYVKCGDLLRAQEILEEQAVKNVASYNALIAGCIDQGNASEAMHHFEQMKYNGLSPDVITYCNILKACGSMQSAKKGEQVHHEISTHGLLETDAVLGSSLIKMYVNCGAFIKAKQVFDELPLQDVDSWNAVIMCYTQQDKAEDALSLFKKMKQKGISPDETTFVCALQACGYMGSAGLQSGEELFCEAARRGLLEGNTVLGATLIDMYVKCGVLRKAHEVLETLPTRDAVTWNALLVGYAQQGRGEQALLIFEKMQEEGYHPNAVTFSCILKACGSVRASNVGEKIHNEVAAQGLLENDVVLGTSLVDMYAKCSALCKAKKIFEGLSVQNVISWNALIAGYALQGHGDQALACFEKMQNEGISPDTVTFLCMLKSCGSIGAVDKGEQIHDEITRQGLLKNNIELGNALVDMYAKCGALTKAQQVFAQLPVRNVVSWNSLITGYAHEGQAEAALNCFEKMQQERFFPNVLTFLSILKACSTLGAADIAEDIHDEIARYQVMEYDIILGTALVDMYAKCGALLKAQNVLEGLPTKTVVPWNALIKGCAQHGQSKQAITLFKSLQSKNLSPDPVTFACILKACGSMGLVDDAYAHFTSMSAMYGIEPDLEHYNCMVDIFGRAGHLSKAVDLIQRMPSVFYSLALWSALLGACAKWGDVNVGKWAFEHAIELDKSDGAAYVLMTNIYADAGMQEDAKRIEAMRIERQKSKEYEIDGKNFHVHYRYVS
ncbi:hypothetical protein KP509_23G032000 [Ceratopteris richardii]|nr:hypothetical protein KP509_23G032000 [Ceratopteris richardii]